MIYIPVSTSSIFTEPIMTNCFVTASMSIKQKCEINKLILIPFYKKSACPNRLQNNPYFFEYARTVEQNAGARLKTESASARETLKVDFTRRYDICLRLTCATSIFHDFATDGVV